MALDIKGVDYQRVPPPGGYSTPEYMKRIPLGTIPGIQDGDLKISEPDRYHDLWLEPHLRALFAQIDPRSRDEQEPADRLDKYQARLDKLEELIDPKAYMITQEISVADIAFPAKLPVADRPGVQRISRGSRS